MSEPGRNSGRSLDDILREAGHEPLTKPGRRRRWDDVPGGAPPADVPPSTGPRQQYARRKGDPPLADPRPAGSGRRAPDASSTAAIPGIRPSRKPGVPSPSGRAAPPPAQPGGFASTGPIPIAADRSPAGDRLDTGPDTGRRPARQLREDRVREDRFRPADLDDVDDDGELDDERGARAAVSGGRESVLAWARFVGELVVALVAGIAVYFAFTLLWQLMPYVAVLVAPLAVTGLVGVVEVWRRRQGLGPIRLRLMAALLFAGTLLVIVPAAGLLAAT